MSENVDEARIAYMRSILTSMLAAARGNIMWSKEPHFPPTAWLIGGTPETNHFLPTDQFTDTYLTALDVLKREVTRHSSLAVAGVFTVPTLNGTALIGDLITIWGYGERYIYPMTDSAQFLDDQRQILIPFWRPEFAKLFSDIRTH